MGDDVVGITICDVNGVNELEPITTGDCCNVVEDDQTSFTPCVDTVT